MCGLLQCGPAFDPNGLSTGGYLYNWLQTVLNSPKERVGIYGSYLLLYFFICSVVFTTPCDIFVYSFFSVTVFRGESRVCLQNSLLDFTFFVLEFWVGKTNSNRKSIMKLSAK